LPDAVPAFVWVEGLNGPGAHVSLDESAAHHVVRVCRARVGDSVTATDGQGALAVCRVARITPDVSLQVETIDRVGRARTAVLLCGAPEGQRFDWVVEKLAELGVARVRPITTERGPWPRAALRPDRWKRLAVAALEQSRGRHLLQVGLPMGLEEALEAEGPPGIGILADPAGVAPGSLRPSEGAATVAAVGPSSGFSDAERGLLLDRGFTAMSLAGARLRTETAALAWAAWWAAPRGA
jgi:16S rRNA (uracil1498-N3)-methyltransferase